MVDFLIDDKMVARAFIAYNETSGYSPYLEALSELFDGDFTEVVAKILWQGFDKAAEGFVFLECGHCKKEAESALWEMRKSV